MTRRQFLQSTAAAGITGPGRIVAIDGQQFDLFGSRTILDGIRTKAGQPVVVTVIGPGNVRRDVNVTLRNGDQDHGTLGITSPTGLRLELSGDPGRRAETLSFDEFARLAISASRH